MKKKIDKYLEAEMDDEQEEALKGDLIDSSTPEGEMFRSFRSYKQQVALPQTKVKSRASYLLVAASIVLILAASLVFFFNEFQSQDISNDWVGMTSSERINYLHKISGPAEYITWKMYSEEKNINVRMALLRVLEAAALEEREFDLIVSNESSPLLLNTLTAMK